jgi:metal-responsive CopG/Arc/MetJ family transcriptional regulator
MGKATGNISQKVIPVKLNKQEIEALDLFVKMGGFNGRSHALREMAKPYMIATQVAIQSQSQVKAGIEMLKAQIEINKRIGRVAREAKKNAQQILPGLVDEELEITIIPDPAPA